MPRYLRHLCDNYEDENKCPPEILNAMAASEIKPGEGVPMPPLGKEEEKLDLICEKCRFGHFEINKMECPVCHSRLVSTRVISEFSYGPVKPSHTIYLYKCEDCKKPLFSYTKL